MRVGREKEKGLWEGGGGACFHSDAWQWDNQFEFAADLCDVFAQTNLLFYREAQSRLLKMGAVGGCRKSRWLFGIIFSAVVCENILLKLIRGTRCGASAWRHRLAAGRSSPGAGWLECACWFAAACAFCTEILKARVDVEENSIGWLEQIGRCRIWWNLLAELSGEPATDFFTVCFQS